MPNTPLLLLADTQTVIRSVRRDNMPLSMLAIAQREGEDAKITGMTRSLHRRLLALNVPAAKKPMTTVSVSQMGLLAS